MARIYAAYLATVFIFLTCLIVLPAGTFRHVPSITVDRLVRTIFFDFGGTGGYVYVGWTLFYEMAFYLCFSFLILRFPVVAKSRFFHDGIASGLLVCYFFKAHRIADFLVGISIFLLASRSLNKGDGLACYALLAALALGVIFHPVGLFCGVFILFILAVEDMAPSMFRSSQSLRWGIPLVQFI